MKIKLTNREVISLYNTLEGLNYRGVKFAYTIARNLHVMKPIMNAMDKALKVAPEFSAYEKARVALAKDFADKDEKGKPKVEGNNFVITRMDEFDVELEKLRETHKAAVEARQKQLDDYAVLQDEEVEIEVFQVAQGLLPADISTQEVNAIFAIIEHDTPVVSPLSKELSPKNPKKGKKGK